MNINVVKTHLDHAEQRITEALDRHDDTTPTDTDERTRLDKLLEYWRGRADSYREMIADELALRARVEALIPIEV